MCREGSHGYRLQGRCDAEFGDGNEQTATYQDAISQRRSPAPSEVLVLGEAIPDPHEEKTRGQHPEDMDDMWLMVKNL